MRGKEVVTHGVPFYSGWGLTTDLGPVPVRRTARRTVDELVAATLLLYPRYLDPVSGLPCPAETVVGRLCSEAPKVGMLPVVRRLQGRLKRSLRVLVR
jgi:capsular polysaccharide export protein